MFFLACGSKLKLIYVFGVFRLKWNNKKKTFLQNNEFAARNKPDKKTVSQEHPICTVSCKLHPFTLFVSFEPKQTALLSVKVGHNPLSLSAVAMRLK
jgi:hypothetical protein